MLPKSSPDDNHILSNAIVGALSPLNDNLDFIPLF